MSRIGWIDASAGVSGDMLLGACFGAGARVGLVTKAIEDLGLPERIAISIDEVRRGALAATRAVVRTADGQHHRTPADIMRILERLPAKAKAQATAVFTALGKAEAAVHGVPFDEVHFHEVGALDSIADIVGVVVALGDLGIDRLITSPIALGGGTARTDHGRIPVPVPAVLELLSQQGLAAFGGPIDLELATPTGVALLSVLSDGSGDMPPGRVHSVGVGAGGRDPEGHTNVCRLVVLETATPARLPLASHSELVLEANVDDLDPRVWPSVLALLIDAGASDAWLTPMLMKKGRPAHTLSVLCHPSLRTELTHLVFAHTSTIGLRTYGVEKLALARETATVSVAGHPVRAKVSSLGGVIQSVTPEFDDALRVSTATGIPLRQVMNAAQAAADAARNPARTSGDPDQVGQVR